MTSTVRTLIMSDVGSAAPPVVDKRAVVRVGLHSRSISTTFKQQKQQQQQAPPSNNQQYQFVRQLPVSDGDMSGGNGDDEDSDSARRRDGNRHAPYRKQQQQQYGGGGEFQTGSVSNVTYKLEREDSSDGQITQDSNDACSEDHANSGAERGGPTYRIVPQEDGEENEGGEEGPVGLQSIALKGLTAGGGGVPTSGGATIVQYTQGPNGQLFIPVHQLNASGLVFPPGLMVSSPGGGPGGCSPPLGLLDESCKKRELRLLKNKEAAKECRRKKKEYVKCLENRVAVLENQNKTLIEELKSLKELYCQKDIHS